jgi:hypothetical protein
MGCQLCVGVAAVDVLKICLDRGQIRGAHEGCHFDTFCSKLIPCLENQSIAAFVLVLARLQLVALSPRGS